MKINYFRAGVAGVSALALLTGCIDDNYDLSDIDTTTELKVNDLVIPVNLASITLDNVIDIDEDDPDATIKYVEIDGKKYFAIEKHGDFHAEPTTIKEVVASKPTGIKPIEQTLSGEPVAVNGARKKAPGAGAMKYIINEDNTDFTYEMRDVDEAIESVKEIRMADHKLNIEVILTSPDILQTAEYVEFENLELRLPDGMKATCDEGTVNGNVLSVPYLHGNGNQAVLHIVSDDINLTTQYGENGIIVTDQMFDYTSELGVIKGDLYVTPKSGSAAVPSDIHFTINYDLSAFTVTEFSGGINYATKVENIDDVSLSDLPDFLAGDDTNLIMSNPQLTLNVNNPAGAYQLMCISGLTINSIRDGVVDGSQSLPGDFEIGYEAKSGPYTFVIAPHPDKAINMPTTGHLKKYPFPGLSYILAGNGIPDKLNIELASPTQPEPRITGDAKNFPLGRELQDVDGSYTFMTRLALDDGSRIVYEKTDDGWNDADVDAIKISSFTVSATATTDIPCGVKLTARPVGLDGKDIEITNPESATTEIPAMADNEPFSITLDGDIQHLDGIHFIATAEGFNGEALVPSQTIKLDNLKVRVTGTYTKEL